MTDSVLPPEPYGQMEVAADDIRPKLSLAQAQRLVELINKKTKSNFSCQLCDTNDWEVPDQLVAMPVSGMTDEGVFYQGLKKPSMMFAVMVCQGCGNTQFLNIESLGFDLVAVARKK